VPSALKLIAEYCQRIEDSDAEVDAINRKLPEGCKSLLSAEQIARGYAGYTWGTSGDVVSRLRDLRLPHFDRYGTAWPDTEGMARRQQEAAAAARKTAKKAAAEREASKKRYFVSRAPGARGMIILAHEGGRVSVLGPPIDCWLYPHQVVAAEKQGLLLEAWSEERAKAIEAALRERAEAMR
jgi:hypothetical protein